MATRLIELEDGILVEAEVSEEEAQSISTSVVKEVKSTFDKVKPILVSISLLALIQNTKMLLAQGL